MKVIFADCGGLVNNNLQAQYNANLLSYVKQLKKIVTVKSVTAQKKPQKKPEPGRNSNLPAGRVKALLQQNLMGSFNKK